MKEKVYCTNCKFFIRAQEKHFGLLDLRSKYDRTEFKYTNWGWVKRSNSLYFSLASPICIARIKVQSKPKHTYESEFNYALVLVDDPRDLNKTNNCILYKPTILHKMYSKINNFFKEFVA